MTVFGQIRIQITTETVTDGELDKTRFHGNFLLEAKGTMIVNEYLMPVPTVIPGQTAITCYIGDRLHYFTPSGWFPVRTNQEIVQENANRMELERGHRQMEETLRRMKVQHDRRIAEAAAAKVKAREDRRAAWMLPEALFIDIPIIFSLTVAGYIKRYIKSKLIAQLVIEFTLMGFVAGFIGLVVFCGHSAQSPSTPSYSRTAHSASQVSPALELCLKKNIGCSSAQLDKLRFHGKFCFIETATWIVLMSTSICEPEDQARDFALALERGHQQAMERRRRLRAKHSLRIVKYRRNEVKTKAIKAAEAAKAEKMKAAQEEDAAKLTVVCVTVIFILVLSAFVVGLFASHAATSIQSTSYSHKPMPVTAAEELCFKKNICSGDTHLENGYYVPNHH